MDGMKQVTRREFVALGGALGAALSVGIAFPRVAVAGTPDVIDEVWSDPATDTTIVAAARCLGTAPLRLEVSEDSSFATSTLHPAQDVSPDAQGYAQVTASGLKPNTQHYYRWLSNGTLAAGAEGKCKTLATSGVPTSFKFISLSCVTTSANPAYFATLAQLDSAFTLFAGDFYYENTKQNTSRASTFRNNWHKPHMHSNRVAWLKGQGHKIVWSDHDYLGADTDGTTPNGDIVRGVYRQVVPHPPLPRTGDIGRSFTSGRVQFFMMDTQSYRSPQGATDDSTKTMLGAEQKAALKAWLLQYKDYPKVIESPPVWHGTSTNNDDWGSYSTERAEIVQYCKDNAIGNIVIIGHDMHAHAYADASNGTPGGWPVFQSAPATQVSTSKGGPYANQYPTAVGVQVKQYGYFVVTDNEGSTVSITFNPRNSNGKNVFAAKTHEFTNVPVPNVAPENVTLSGDTTATEGDTKNYTVSATDANGDSLTYGLLKDSGTAEVQITDIGGGSFDVTFLTPGSVDLKASASDGTATSFSQVKNVLVASANTAPLAP
jgi:phosphodiesterase/alkaline phosphatase D-like protein